MQYEIYKLKFPYGVHIGAKALENSEKTFCADTLFSALAIEALKNDQTVFDKLLDYVKTNKLVLSDGFPFVGDELFLPKPYLKIEGVNDGSSVVKKQYKKMKYVAMSKWKLYLSGKLNPLDEIELEKHIGSHSTKTHCAIRGLEETKPYRIGTYTFSEMAGVYIIYGYNDDTVKEFFYDLLEKLSFSGIGGKRSSGLGRFEIYPGKMPEEILSAIDKDSSKYVSLSISLPGEDELESALKDSSYMLEKRSGFVDSKSYSDSFMRKKDLFMFVSGSVFSTKYCGDVYDVSSGGKHPVYKYGKPIFLGV